MLKGEVVDIGGIKFKMDGDGKVRVGDLYIAERNTGPHLLECRKVNEELGCVYATTPAYPFDTNECVKVCEA